jgi:hypothetical protein
VRVLHGKSRHVRVLDNIGDVIGGLASGTKRSTLVKAGVVAGGLATLAAGSAAVSSLRRRLGENDS